MKAIRLRTEYLYEPLGIDIIKPRLFWNCEGGIKQTAYRVTVKQENNMLWDSGKVSSDSMCAQYSGLPLSSRMRLDWSVTLWDENGVEGESSTSHFEMGLLEKSDWQAKWITGDYKPKKKIHYPVDYFIKKFEYKDSVKRARLYITAHGVYDVKINNRKIDDFFLAPGSTDYSKRLQYQTYDVTDYICKNNTIKLRLADGWFRGNVAAFSMQNLYGVQTAIFAQLEIENECGEICRIVTDDSFLWSNDGPIRFADLKDGEVYDATKSPTYSGRAKVVSIHSKLVSSNNVYVKEHEKYNAKLLIASDSTHVLDFGQNLAGIIKFKVKGEHGQKFKIVMGEVLDKDGRVDLSGVQCKKPINGWGTMSLVKNLLGAQPKKDFYLTPKQEIVFTCSGNIDEYKTAFSVFGFRYAEIVGDIEVNADNFTAIAIYSDIERTGSFTCSDEKINKLVQNTVMSVKGNFLDVPTDCPTRERLGWTGDAQAFFDTGAYLFNTAAFFRKWLIDMRDSQFDNGLISAVMPFGGVNKLAGMMYKATGSSVGWADAIYLIPYRYYKRFNDISILNNSWDMIRRYTDYLISNTGLKDKKAAKKNPYNKYTYEKGVHLGEWLEPEEFRDTVYGTKARHPEECTAYLFYTMCIVGEIASILGKTDYIDICKEYAEGAKKAYNHLFVKSGMLDTDRQAKLVRPLALGLLDGDDKAYAQKRLVKAVENYDYRVGTGFLSTPFLLSTLADAGRSDVAYKVLENSKIPGWLAEVENGATTIWEDWEGKLSQNHYSLGAVVGWLFDTVGGICISGENSFYVHPVPGGTIRFAKVEYLSLYGKITSEWRITDGELTFKVTVPDNTQATVVMPNGEIQVVGNGEHVFKCGE